MGKRKKKRKKSKVRRAPLRVLLERGAEAWQRGREADALRLWQRAWDKAPSPALAAALGELYFRRGARALADSPAEQAIQEAIADLERAREFLPDDERPLYYLGLAYHRLGELQKAQTFYQQVLERQPAHRRAAYHLVLAALEQRQDPRKTPAWSLLPPSQQADVLAAWHVLAKQGSHLLRSSDAVHPLWLGLAALDGWRPDKELARQALEQVLSQEKEGSPRYRLAQIYLGNLLWPTDKLAAACHWDQASRSSPPPWVERNRAVGAALLARQALEADDPHAAFPYARLALAYAPDQKAYKEIMAHVHFLLGNQVAEEEQWPEAVRHWEEARRLGGESFPLFHNLALGYEHLEQWENAAAAWREFLRRRPRRADAPLALTPQQEARVRRHIATLYWRAGNEKEGLRFYRQALAAGLNDEKEEISLRLELAEFLAARKRWSMAEQTLREGLKRHPDHPELLQALGLLYEERGQDRQALEIWERALQVSPEHPLIQERLADHLAYQGDLAAQRGRWKEAQDLYERALTYAPEYTDLRISLADVYSHRQRWDDAKRVLEEALDQAPDDPYLLASVIGFWLSWKKGEQLKPLLQRAADWDPEQQAALYAMVGTDFYKYGRQEQGKRYLQRAFETGPIPSLVAVKAGLILLKKRAYDLAISLLEHALKFDPAEPRVSIVLAVAYTLTGRRSRARRVIGEARRVAEQVGDRDTVTMLEEASWMIRQDAYAFLFMLDLLAKENVI